MENDVQAFLVVHVIPCRSEYEFLKAIGITFKYPLLENLTSIGFRCRMHEGKPKLHPDETMFDLRSAWGAAKLWKSVGLRSLGGCKSCDAPMLPFFPFSVFSKFHA